MQVGSGVDKVMKLSKFPSLGAGGHTCPVAKRLLERIRRPDAGDETRSARRFARVVCGTRLQGLSWYFTKGDFLNIGVGCIGKRPNVHERLEILLDRFRRTGRLPAKLELTKFRGHAYSVYRRHVRRPVGEGFALIGDAAGLAKDFSGEGIGPAVHSAKMAARAAHVYLETGEGLIEYAGSFLRNTEAVGKGCSIN